MLLLGSGDFALLHHEENVPDAHDVRLALFQRRILFLQFLVHRRLAAILGNRTGPEAVGQFMEQRFQFHVLLRDQCGLILLQHDIADRIQNAFVFCAEYVGQNDLLGTFGFAHPLVIGKVESDGLYAWYIVAPTVDLIGHRDGAFEAALEILVAILDRKVAFHIAQVILVLRQSGALFGIAQRDEAFESGFRTVQTVGIDFVRSNRDFDRRVGQVHPRHFAFVIVVGQEAGGTQCQEFLEARVARTLGSLFQKFGSRF